MINIRFTENEVKAAIIEWLGNKGDFDDACLEHIKYNYSGLDIDGEDFVLVVDGILKDK